MHLNNVALPCTKLQAKSTIFIIGHLHIKNSRTTNLESFPLKQVGLEYWQDT